MAELRRYSVTIDGNTTDMLLDDEEAKRYGDAAVAADGQTAPDSDTTSPAPAEPDPADDDPKRVQNKARTAAK